MSLGHGANIIREGLRCLIDPANTKSINPTSSQALDLSGNSNHGIIKNQTGTQTSLGSMSGVLEYDITDVKVPCLNFVGLGDTSQGYIEWSSHPCEGDTSYSVESFFKIVNTTPNADYNVIFYSSSTGSNQEFGLMAQNSTTDPDVAIEIGNAYTGGSTNVRASLGWHHFALTFDGSTSILYLDGENVYSRSDTNDALGSTWNWVGVGQWANSSNYGGANGHTQGKLGYLSLYGKALSDQEVKQNFEALRGRYGI